MKNSKNTQFHTFEIELAEMSKCFSHPAQVMII